MSNKSKNYWPHAIVAVLVFMVFAVSMVVKIAIDNPVQMDSYYFEQYQQVDKNIDDIRAKQKIFDESFTITYNTKKFTMNKINSFKMSILDNNSQTLIENAEIKLVVTRPDTNEDNQEIHVTKSTNGEFIFEGIKAQKPGRWQILTMITINDKIGFNKYEVYASK